MSLSITRENFDEWTVPVYAPVLFILVRGEGLRLWDQQGKEYIDFAEGIMVDTLGHVHPALRETLNDQANRFWHAGNGYTSEPVLCLVKKSIGVTLAECIFPYNSGAEANEAALKLARKYVHDRFGSQKNGIVAFRNVFHGRTLFTVSAGGQPAYSQDFALLPPDIRHAVYNDPDSASQLIGDATCAVIVGPMWGEGGMVLTTEAFSQGLRELCGRHNALLIFDEVQTDVSRTGELYAYMYYGVTPDLLATAKALDGGFPIGALSTTERYASMMTVGTHGTTHGENPLAVTAVGKSLGIVSTPEVFNGIKQRHDWFVEYIDTINERFELFSEICGFGLLTGCVLSTEFAGKAKFISQEAAVVGMMALITGANVVHSVPTLNVSGEEVATGLDRFALVCEYIKAGGSS